MSSQKNIPVGFTCPTDLPHSPEQQKKWQQANKSWWENNPMRYDWKSGIAHEEFSKEFYQEIDNRFFEDVKQYMPWEKLPFDRLIDFDSLSDKDVLEIGVGNGSHAQLLASSAQSFTGVDLTEYAVKSTSKRLRCFDIDATILRMDAEHMEFEDNSFDFIWSWGVIHHSANTRQILEEIHRTLRPGGQAVIMVYHRSLWHYYLMGGLFKGILQGSIFKRGAFHKTIQNNTDGAIARYYTISEWQFLVSDLFAVDNIAIYGSKTELIPLPYGKFKKFLVNIVPDSVGRFFTNRLRFGSFLVSVLKKQ